MQMEMVWPDNNNNGLSWVSQIGLKTGTNVTEDLRVPGVNIIIFIE